MRKHLRTLVALLSILVALTAIFLTIYRLGSARNSGERSAGAQYSILRNSLVSVSSFGDFQDSLLRNRLLSLYGGSDRLLAAQVLDSSGLVAWKIPADSTYFAMPGDSQVRAGFSAPEWSTVVYTTPLANGMKLLALYATVRRSDLSAAASLPALIVLVWTAISIFLFFVLRKTPREIATQVPSAESGTIIVAEPAAESEAEPEAVTMAEPEAVTAARVTSEELDVSTSHDVPNAETGLPIPPLPLKEKAEPRNFEEDFARLEEEIVEWSARHEPGHIDRDHAEVPEPERIIDDLDEELDEIDEDTEDDLEEPEEAVAPPEETPDEDETLREFEELTALEASPAPAEKPAPRPVMKKEAPSGRTIIDLPMSLALADTALENRLDESIERGINGELSLMLIHCVVSGPSDPAASALMVTLRDYIGSKDLVFEVYKGAFAVVLPSVDLGGTLKMSEDLADVLAATIDLYRDRDENPCVFIGISARSGRKLDSQKLYREASTALHKAYSSQGSNILAFRPAADKTGANASH